MHRSALLATLFVLACAGKRVPTSSFGADDSGRTATVRSVPDQVFSLVLRKPLSAAVFNRYACVGARDFAFRRGSYSIVTDDVLLGVPHEHQDTTAVLAALDSFTVCVGETRELRATAVVTLSDSAVASAHIFWTDESQAPQYDTLLAIMQRTYGEPIRNAYGDHYWSGDSIKLYLNHRGFYNDGTSLSLRDARECERFEKLVHRQRAAPVYVDSLGNFDPRSNYCWVPTVR